MAVIVYFYSCIRFNFCGFVNVVGIVPKWYSLFFFHTVV